MRDADNRAIAAAGDARSVQTRMLRALVAFVTIMTGAAVAVAQTVTPDDPGIAEPGPAIGGLESWWWVVIVVVLAVVVVWYAQRRRGRGPR
ncbi:hypothetical protein [Salinarimonas chemoclinalis]|uniref:hypothetical protein n=1 Tax=Salinarimonas chemoclinalis TaxID=3241599 RepID=UPI0035573424